MKNILSEILSTAKTDAHRLLEACLDSTGHICIVGLIAGANPSQKFFGPGQLDAAIECAMRLDAEGRDSYFATSTFQNPSSRKAENVRSVKTMKLDLDVSIDSDKKYATQAEALADLKRFCKAVNLPRPVVVNSGGGLHIYWPLSVALTPGEAKQVSEKLKSLCSMHGLRADPCVTSDLARILRVPDTKNYKQDVPREVKLLTKVHTFDTVNFIELMEAAYAAGAPAPIAVSKDVPLFSGASIPLHLRHLKTDDVTSALAGRKPKSFQIILEKSIAGTGCEQLKFAYENQASIDEPRWRAVLSIAQLCKDRAEAIHQISKGHADYSPEETEQKATSTLGPMRCDTFASNWPEQCTGCTHKITSPIQLGVESDAAANDAHQWQPPEPLPDNLLPVMPFDFNLLPVALQPWANDIVHRMQSPPDFVGVAIMSALGTVIGRRIGIRPKQFDDWTEYCNLWACIVGRPGVMKSPALEAALAPLKSLSARASEQYKTDKAAYDATAQIHAMRVDAEKKNIAKTLTKNPSAQIHPNALIEPAAPTLKRYLINDSTVEVLLDICIENPQGVCCYRDELVGLLKSFEKQGQESARGFYLTGWNGNSGYTVDRIGRGKNMHAEAVCLSVFGSTQPGGIGEYLRSATVGGSRDDGLIQRVSMLVWPDISPAWTNVDRWPDAQAKAAAYQLFEKLDAEDPVTDWGAETVTGQDGQPLEGMPPFLRFDQASLALFVKWHTGLQSELRSGMLHVSMEAHLSKYKKLVPSLALICHLADGVKGAVGIDALTRAIAWARYLRSHAERAYGAGTRPDVAGAKTLIERIKKGDLLDGFTARSVYINEWSMLSSKQDVVNALKVLMDSGWLRSMEQQTEGRTKTVYFINPIADILPTV